MLLQPELSTFHIWRKYFWQLRFSDAFRGDRMLAFPVGKQRKRLKRDNPGVTLRLQSSPSTPLCCVSSPQRLSRSRKGSLTVTPLERVHQCAQGVLADATVFTNKQTCVRRRKAPSDPQQQQGNKDADCSWPKTKLGLSHTIVSRWVTPAA